MRLKKEDNVRGENKQKRSGKMTVLEARVAYSEFPWVFLKSWLLLTLLECAISLFMEVQIQHSTENKNRGCNDDPALHTLLSQALRHFKSNQRHLRWRCNAVSLTAPPPPTTPNGGRVVATCKRLNEQCRSGCSDIKEHIGLSWLLSLDFIICPY